MAANCKCGGKFKYFKWSSPENHAESSGFWECQKCNKHFEQKKRKPKTQSKGPSSSFNPLQAGIAIAEYIRSLEDQVTELRSCVSDRDALQTQVYSLQERLNELKLSDTNLIHIPIGRGK